jgi:hypothetical protein
MALALTVNVTGTVMGEFDAPAAFTVTFAV